MPRSRALIALAAAIPLLAGCELDDVPLTPRDAVRLASKVGELSRTELSGNDIEGRTYELTAKSRRAANWRDANFALRTSLQQGCPDGRAASTISTSPAARSAADREVVHPAGTIFRRVITCPPAPHFEFVLEQGLERQEINEIFRERLNAGNTGFPRDPYVQPIQFTSLRPKYKAVQEALGTAAFFFMEKCKGGVSFDKLAVGVLPERAPKGHAGSRSADAYVGYLFECKSEAD